MTEPHTPETMLQILAIEKYVITEVVGSGIITLKVTRIC
jgi:hypothetical protein